MPCSICLIWSVMYFFWANSIPKAGLSKITIFQFALSEVLCIPNFFWANSIPKAGLSKIKLCFNLPYLKCIHQFLAVYRACAKCAKKGESLRLILKVNFKNLFGFVGRLGDKLFCWALACWISLFIWRLASLKEINNLIRHQPTRSHRTTFLNIHNQIYLEQTKTFLSKKIF